MRVVIALSLLVGLLAAVPAVQGKEAGAPLGQAAQPPSLGALQVRAQRGDAQAQYELAQRYAGQSGDTLDLQQAFVYTHQAAEHGHRAAQVDLAFAYYNGSAQVAKDLAASFQWFRKAAEGGAVIAQCMLGDFYRNGLGGVRQDSAEAFKWYRRTADGTDRCAPKSQYALYLSYESGQGVKRDLATATSWLKTAAAAGNPQAQATLGLNYERGHGVSADPYLAKYWRKKSREGVSSHDDHDHDEPPTRWGARPPPRR